MPRLSKDGSVHITDEIYNTLISSLGAILSLVGGTFLVYRAQGAGHFWHVLGFSVYGMGLVNTFASSALHHGVNGSPKTNHLLRQLDYFAIFITMYPVNGIIIGSKRTIIFVKFSPLCRYL